ncbi:MAG: hypothetical protein ABEL76_08515, partial [Bradymonadaceae bacterium]
MFSADHSHHDRPRSPGPTAVGSLVERWSRLCLFVSATCLLVQPLGGCQIGSANCTSNSDCTDGRTCIDGGGVFWRGGRCVATCSTAGATDQCPPGRVCTSSGYCAPADAGHLDGGRSDGGADGGRACRPCSLPHARPTCNGGTCEIEACETGWQNKDGAAGNGCECRVRTETCDGVDENCDGTPDDGCDDDGDGFCDAEMTV